MWINQMEKRFSFNNIDKAPKEQRLIFYKICLKSYKKRNSAFVNSLDDDVYQKHIAWYKQEIKKLEKIK